MRGSPCHPSNGKSETVMIDEQPNSLDLTFRTARDARVVRQVVRAGVGKNFVKPLKGFTLPTVIDPKVGLADRVEETFRGRVSVFQ